MPRKPKKPAAKLKADLKRHIATLVRYGAGSTAYADLIPGYRGVAGGCGIMAEASALVLGRGKLLGYWERKANGKWEMEHVVHAVDGIHIDAEGITTLARWTKEIDREPGDTRVAPIKNAEVTGLSFYQNQGSTLIRAKAYSAKVAAAIKAGLTWRDW